MIATIRTPGSLTTGDLVHSAGRIATVRDGKRVYAGELANPTDAELRSVARFFNIVVQEVADAR